MSKRAGYKYIICADCGQTGATLVKREKGDTVEMVCKARGLCGIRQRKIALVGKLCSRFDCGEKASVLCSCGMCLCEVHAGMRAHATHTFEEL